MLSLSQNEATRKLGGVWNKTWKSYKRKALKGRRIVQEAVKPRTHTGNNIIPMLYLWWVSRTVVEKQLKEWVPLTSVEMLGFVKYVRRIRWITHETSWRASSSVVLPFRMLVGLWYPFGKDSWLNFVFQFYNVLKSL